jgi:L-histidine N-alpha-methyltransferase
MNTFPHEELIAGLRARPRSIPCDYYYDDYGSKLFDIQCMQEDYYLFRSESEIIGDQGAELLRLCQPEVLVDLGCGTCEKTLALLQHALRGNSGNGRVREVVLVDLNSFILDLSAAKIKSAFPELRVRKLNLTYFSALDEVRRLEARKAVLLLGGNIGNMRNGKIRTLLRALADSLSPGDACILGVDKHKSPEIIERAYNDRNGIARLTNLNVLSHINRLYDGNINVDQFMHKAIYYPDEFTSKSYLISMADQAFCLQQLGVSVELGLGEPILTEIERKFEIPYLHRLLEGCGLFPGGSFQDKKGWFNVELFFTR